MCFAKSGPISIFLLTPACTYLPAKEQTAARNFTYYIRYLHFSVKSKLLQMTTVPLITLDLLFKTLPQLPTKYHFYFF